VKVEIVDSIFTAFIMLIYKHSTLVPALRLYLWTIDYRCSCAFCSWVNCLSPEINKSAWTDDENAFLLQLHDKFGNHWAEIAKYLPGR